MSDNKEFWNDKNVGEFAIWYKGLNFPFLDPIAEFKKSKEAPDYEILSFNVDTHVIYDKKPTGLFGHFGNGILSEKEMINSGHEIHSVKRLSDQSVFTIGDITNLGRIERFHLYNKEIIAEFEGGMRSAHFNNLQKVPQKRIICETMDEVHLYSGDDYWMLNTFNWTFAKFTATDETQPPRDHFLFFVKKDSMENFITNYKPVTFSFRELTQLLPDTFTSTNKVLKKIFKSKTLNS